VQRRFPTHQNLQRKPDSSKCRESLDERIRDSS
jgi:hypothetical protein